MSNKNIICLMGLMLLSGLSLVSCNDWTQVEPVEQNVTRPSEDNPELWAQYIKVLKEYKQSKHSLVFASFKNGTLNATSEKDFLRCLPDSLDIVSLTNADNFSAYDIEDMAVMREKNIRVLYLIDYASRIDEFTDLAVLGTYIDRVIASVKDLGLNGIAFSGTPILGGSEAEQADRQAAAKLLVDKLSAVAGPGKELVLVFEGNPLFVAAADRAKIDYFVLDTKTVDNATDLKLAVLDAVNFAAVPRAKVLVSAQTESEFVDEDLNEFNAITAVALRVVDLGPLAGICVYDVNKDYFGAEFNYPLTRGAIQTLNPSK